jgi:ADP-heptose:LPS heptosyltransferase
MDQIERQCRDGIIPVLDMLSDFSETAALIEQLDLVISVDTAVAHLAGALGRPTWLLLPAGPDWRWGQRGERTDWYPTMRIFRQKTPGDWQGVVAEVQRALQA